jgi:hypothetical protein
MNKVVLASLVFLSFTPAISFAQGAPELGDTRAFAHQQCGKDITLQIGNTAEGHAVIGLKNKNTGELDLFVSSSQFDITSSFSPFKPVKFDNLSKNLIETHDKDIDIVWGASHDEKQQNHHRLALGNYTYDCEKIIAWPNDKANDLYGETQTKTVTQPIAVSAEQSDTPSEKKDTTEKPATSGKAASTPPVKSKS